MKAQQVNIKMSNPTDASSNGEYLTCLEESESSFSPEKRHASNLKLVGISNPNPNPTNAAPVNNEKTIYDVPDAVLALSFAFVGKGNYLFTAGVCKTFHKVYKHNFEDSTATSMEVAVATIACAETCLEEDNGGLEEIDWKMDIYNKNCYIWIGAARHGRVDMLEWMNNCYPSSFYMTDAKVAATHGQLDALKWFHAHDEYGLHFDPSYCATAARGGHLSVIQWLKENGCPWNESSCANAAYGGHLPVLQWLRDNGCPWDESSCANAAHGGHLSVLQWCHAHGCPWYEFTCANAAFNGNLPMIQWCRANGCSWCESTCASAAESGHLALLQWCHANGCP